MPKFFINRPIFAWVISILIMMAGVAAIFTLPISQYPSVAPPTVMVSAYYPGASAETVENTVTQVIEQQMTGLDHLLYMSASSDNSGMASVILTFALGTNPDTAQVQVQNQLQLAMPLMPEMVQKMGVRVAKGTSSFLMVAAFSSEDGSMDKYDLSNYVASHIQDPISRVNGVGTVTLFGSQYAMRIWLNPSKLTSYGLTPLDVTNAIQVQNVQVAGGSIGGTPSTPDTVLQASITEATLLRTPEQFGNILLKVNSDGSKVRLKDVAKVGLGGVSYDFDSQYNNKNATGLAIQLASGANALQTEAAVKAKLAELEKYFPHGLKTHYPYETASFVKISIKDVVHTLIEGIILVFLVMYLFLQNLRATLIPTIAVPVVLLGTFAIMAALGFSINTLSMFGMVLAIGLLVDDAIVVVENVERVMAEEGLSPKAASEKAMSQITGALVGVALVLSAVFVPVAFSGGSVGAIYRQFALTIISAMGLSVFVAMTLTPALCATLLKPIKKGHYEEKKGFFGWFNHQFERSRKKYVVQVHNVLKRSKRWLLIYIIIVVVVGALFVRLPTSFLPDEDQGHAFILIQLPTGATQQMTAKVISDVSNYLFQDEKQTVDSVFAINGFSFIGRSQNVAMVFIHLRDFDKRTAASQSVQALIRRIAAHFSNYSGAVIVPINPSPIPDLGTSSGFDFELMDDAGLGHEALMAARNQLLGMAAKNPSLSFVRANGLPDTPSYQINIDRAKAMAQGVSPSDVDRIFSIAWASQYVNNFLDMDNRIKKVYVQADAPFRMKPEDLHYWYVRNKAGQMVPFSSFASGQWTFSSPKLERYNGVSSIEIQGVAGPGKSTGQAMKVMEQLTSKLPKGFGFSWTGMSFQEIQSGSQAPIFYAISMVVVFLCLAALYESWSIPFSVILVVPLGVIGALLAVTLRGLENNVYFQVGLLTTIGLSAKNAILIVEFARELQEKEGMGPFEAALEAARMRLRPILMTSIAFIFGVLPMAIKTGAGAASQHALGTGVIGGMLTATFLAIYLVPMFFVLVRSLFNKENEDPERALKLAQEHLAHAEGKDDQSDENNGAGQS